MGKLSSVEYTPNTVIPELERFHFREFERGQLALFLGSISHFMGITTKEPLANIYDNPLVYAKSFIGKLLLDHIDKSPHRDIFIEVFEDVFLFNIFIIGCMKDSADIKKISLLRIEDTLSKDYEPANSSEEKLKDIRLEQEIEIFINLVIARMNRYIESKLRHTSSSHTTKVAPTPHHLHVPRS